MLPGNFGERVNSNLCFCELLFEFRKDDKWQLTDLRFGFKIKSGQKTLEFKEQENMLYGLRNGQ